MKNITQLHGVSPEEFKQEILNGLRQELTFLKKDFKPKEPSEFLTRKEVSELLSISLVNLHSWCNKEILTPYRIGNKVLFKREEIEQSLIKINKP